MSGKQISFLDKLPPELVLNIINDLDPIDRMCLSMVCSYLNSVVKIPPLESNPFYNTFDYELRMKLIRRLAIDLPHQYACLYCAKLHSLNEIPHPAFPNPDEHDPCIMTRLQVPYVVNPLSLLLTIHINEPSRYWFRHYHLTSAIAKHYRSGTQGSIHTHINYTEICTKSHPSITTLLSVRARIASISNKNPSLILQIQNWMLFHTPLISLPPRSYYIRDLPICAHQSLKGPFRLQQSGIIGEHLTGASCYLSPENPCSYSVCGECGVEYEVTIHSCGAYGMAIIVTKYVDLGDGQHMDDPRWAGVSETARWLPWGRDRVPMGLCGLFDSKAMVERNEGLLEGERFREALEERWPGMFCSVP
ncbi:hypothetical protein BJY04DRAFT_224904 [Aspergillus karnatakaensis]|uniref:F-box protein n=1 Tax=Aspergillus karnatakaensis TaxID=1810916 RepID=UPI003CCC9178